MKNLIILIILLTFSACSITSHNKVNSDLQIEPIPENERKTYIFFGKERFMTIVKKEEINLDIEDSLFQEYSSKGEELDPFEAYNRAMTSFNDFIYINFLLPTIKTYAKVINEDIRIGISNFFHNIGFPVRFINNLLQFKLLNAGEELGRFTINSTIGILGFMDSAKEYFNLEKKQEDFGQTLGYYGVGEGFHIVLPFYGPSNLRDTLGLVFDSYFYPLDNIGDLKYKIPDTTEKTIALILYKDINKNSLNPEQYENFKKEAIDLYPFLKDIYTQNRKKLIKE